MSHPVIPRLSYMGFSSSAGVEFDETKNLGKWQLLDPSTRPTGRANKVAFSPDGNWLAVAHNTTPFVSIYSRSGKNMAPNHYLKVANPATLPTGHGQFVLFSPDSQYLVVGHSTTPFVSIYRLISGIWTKISNPTTLPTTTVYSAAFIVNDQLRLVLPRQVYTIIDNTVTYITPVYFESSGRFIQDSINQLNFAYQNTYYGSGTANCTLQFGMLDSVGLTGPENVSAYEHPTDYPSYDWSSSADITPLTFSPNGRLLICRYQGTSGTNYWLSYRRVGDTPQTWYFEPIDGGLVKPFYSVNLSEERSAMSAVFTPDGKFMVAGTQGSYSQVYQVIDDRLIWSHNIPMLGRGSPSSLAISPDGKHLAVGAMSSPYLQIFTTDGTNGEVSTSDLT